MALGRISGRKFQRKKPKRHIRDFPEKFQISHESPVPDRKVYLMGFKEDHGFQIQGNPVKEDSQGFKTIATYQCRGTEARRLHLHSIFVNDPA